MKIKKILHLIWEFGYILIAFIVIFLYRTMVSEGYGLFLRRTLIIGFIWLIISISVYKFAKWIAQKRKFNLKVVKAIGWLNLVSWIIGSFGLIVSSSTIAFAQLLPDSQRKFFKGLAYTSLLLSISNAIAGISHFNLYYVGLISFGVGFLYILIAIAIYLFFVKTNKKEIRVQDKSAENISSEEPNQSKKLGKYILLLIAMILILILGSLYLRERVRNARLIEKNNRPASNVTSNIMESPLLQLESGIGREDDTKPKDTILEIERCRIVSENDALVGEMERFAETFNQLVDKNVSISDEQAKEMWKDWERNRRNEIYGDCLNTIQ
jgi:hypothetical protein